MLAMTSSARAPRPRSTAPARSDCPVDAALQVIGGRWKGSILWRLSERGTMRPGELRRSISGVSEAVLLRQLREMTADGVLERIDTGGYPLEVTYRITAYGATLEPIVEQLCSWGHGHQTRGRTSR